MASKAKNDLPERDDKPLTCGLIMPISSIDGCTAEHWAEVKSIITDAVSMTPEFSFSVNLVSDQEDVGVIQKRIVQNIYDSDVVICDVSCKNPNVMFELGMRLAFDKPTLIIKDDGTDYSFDTGVIEHLNYPRDLRFAKIVAFKQNLANKISATYRASLNDASQSFLSSFGTFKVAKLDQAEGSAEQVLIEMVQDLSKQVSRLGNVGSHRELWSRPLSKVEFVTDVVPDMSGAGALSEVVFISSGPPESVEAIGSTASAMGLRHSLISENRDKANAEYTLTIFGVSPSALAKLKTVSAKAGAVIKELRIS